MSVFYRFYGIPVLHWLELILEALVDVVGFHMVS